MLLRIHPLWQATTTLLGLYTLYLGWQRARAKLFGHKVPFAWKRHVRCGRWAVTCWLIGEGIGLVSAFHAWGDLHMTGTHALLGGACTTLSLAVYASGHFMDKVKKARPVLPHVHGLMGLCLVLLAFALAWTGWGWLDYLPS